MISRRREEKEKEEDVDKLPSKYTDERAKEGERKTKGKRDVAYLCK